MRAGHPGCWLGKGRSRRASPRILALWREFEDYAVVYGAAEDGAAVEVALVVEGQIAGGDGPVDAAEAVQHGVGPFPVAARCQFVHHAATARCGSAVVGRAVEISGLVHHYASGGERSARAGLEIIEDSFLPAVPASQRQPEDRAATDIGAGICAALDGRAVQVPGRVEDQRAAARNLPVLSEGREIVQCLLLPAAGGVLDLEDRARLGGTTCFRRAIEVP